MKPPRLSVGLPVYNGEQFLTQAIDAILGQTFHDLELVISDNASTDRTETICRAYMERDPRVRYFRNEQNLGVNPNYRRTFAYSVGEYFKWAAHDDLHTSNFLEECISVLDHDPGVVLCYTRALIIDEHGQPQKTRSYGMQTDSPRLRNPEERFRDVLWINLGSPPIYGVCRSNVLKRTKSLGSTFAADQVLLAELALYGRFQEIPEELLMHREHPHRSVYDSPSRHSLTAFVEPSLSHGIIFPSWRVWRDYWSAIRRAPISLKQRFWCSLHILRWTRDHLDELWEDLVIAARLIFALGQPQKAPRTNSHD